MMKQLALALSLAVLVVGVGCSKKADKAAPAAKEPTEEVKAPTEEVKAPEEAKPAVDQAKLEAAANDMLDEAKSSEDRAAAKALLTSAGADVLPALEKAIPAGLEKLRKAKKTKQFEIALGLREYMYVLRDLGKPGVPLLRTMLASKDEAIHGWSCIELMGLDEKC